jgi:geranylgeranyl diphosphate synthase, type II
MQTSPLIIPRPVPLQRFRPPKKNIPPTPIQRNHILHAVRNYVAEHNPVPPMPSDELKVHADRLIEILKLDPIYREYVGVLINNEMWRETLASVPFERRLLLLPKCLRIESKCPAPFDEFGLLCKQCGLTLFHPGFTKRSRTSRLRRARCRRFCNCHVADPDRQG